MIDSIKEFLEGTVWGNAAQAIADMRSKSKKIIPIVAACTFLISLVISGVLILSLMNIGRAHYRYSIGNIFGAWWNYGIIPSIILFGIIGIMICNAYFIIQRNYTVDDNNVAMAKNNNNYGSARFMSIEELQETFITGTIADVKETVFGRLPSDPSIVVAQKHPLLKINRNTFVVAGPSAGKSATFVIPLILQMLRRGESGVVSDPKSELFMITSEIAKALGYEVRIMNLNPMFLRYSDPCNFMAYVGEDVDKAMVMSTAIISNTTGGDKLFDFWTEGPKNLLQSIILRINCSDDYTDKEKNLPMVYRYVMEHSGEEIEADFEANIGKDHPAYAPFMIYKDGDEKPKAQVLQGLRMKLGLFNSKTLRRVLSETKGGIDFLNPGRKKCLYFVGSNDQDSTMSPIISLFYTLMYQELVRYADSRNPQVLPITVHMILDEYANMGSIPDFEEKLSTVRSRGIVTYIIVQDINQLKKKHPQETWRTVINDCDYYMMLKTNDPETMAWWSALSGDGTTVVTNKMYENKRTNISGIHNNERNTEGLGTRRVITEDEARRLKDDEAQVFVSQRNMTKVKTFFWKKDHPYGRAICANSENMYILPVQHVPFYRLIEDGIVGEDYDYDHELSFAYEIPEDEEIDIDETYDPDEMLGYSKGVRAEKKKAILDNISLLNKLKKDKEYANKDVKDKMLNKVLDKAGINKNSKIYKFADKLKYKTAATINQETPSYKAHPFKVIHPDGSITCGEELLRAAGSEEMCTYSYKMGYTKKQIQQMQEREKAAQSQNHDNDNIHYHDFQNKGHKSNQEKNTSYHGMSDEQDSQSFNYEYSQQHKKTFKEKEQERLRQEKEREQRRKEKAEKEALRGFQNVNFDEDDDDIEDGVYRDFEQTAEVHQPDPDSLHGDVCNLADIEDDSDELDGEPEDYSEENEDELDGNPESGIGEDEVVFSDEDTDTDEELEEMDVDFDPESEEEGFSDADIFS